MDNRTIQREEILTVDCQLSTEKTWTGTHCSTISAREAA
nr:MAG TPA: hypothetical protein [Caudoviricetes sp.]